MRNESLNALQLLAVIFLFAAIGFIGGYLVAEDRYEMPNCPVEDSCFPSYENGEWHIVPVEQELFPN